MADSINPESIGKVINLRSSQQDSGPPTKLISEVYTPLLVDFYSELGVPDHFLAMMGRYLIDTRVTVNNEIEESEQSVQRIGIDYSEQAWERRTMLSKKHISILGLAVGKVLKEIDVRSRNDISYARVLSMMGKDVIMSKVSPRARSIQNIATNMAFLETTVDVLGNCIYMQHRYDHYIPDFNGSYYKGYDSVSRDFWDSYANKKDEKVHEAAIAQDHRNIRSGVAIMFLSDELLRHELVDTKTEANWVTQAIANNYPTPRRYKNIDSPMKEEDIRKRFMGLYVQRGVILEYAKLF